MNRDPSHLRHQHQTEPETDLQMSHHPSTAQQFASVEEIIRFDASQTVVPEELANRLNQTIAQEPKPARSWWKRLFESKSGSH